MPEISAELVDKLASLAASITAVLSAIQQPADRLSDDIAAQVADRVRRGVCLQCQTELAKEKRVSRGLCYTCYARSIQRVKRQMVTEEWLISNGWILAESSKGGRKSQRPDPVGEMLASGGAITEAEEKSDRSEGMAAGAEAHAEEKVTRKKRNRSKR